MLLLVGVIAHASRSVLGRSQLIRSLAQETLLVYVVHLCLVYGSPWNTGLIQTHGNSMDLVPALGFVAALWIGMTAVAVLWNNLKRSRVRTAAWLRLCGGAVLALRLL